MSEAGDARVPYLFVAVIGRTLVLRGELDLRSGATVATAARTLFLRCRAAGLDGVLDGGGLTFVDAGGVGALVELARVLRSSGLRLTTPTASGSLRRVSDICGLGGVLGLASEAVDAEPVPERNVPHLQAVPPP